MILLPPLARPRTIHLIMLLHIAALRIHPLPRLPRCCLAPLRLLLRAHERGALLGRDAQERHLVSAAELAGGCSWWERGWECYILGVWAWGCEREFLTPRRTPGRTPGWGGGGALDGFGDSAVEGAHACRGGGGCGLGWWRGGRIFPEVDELGLFVKIQSTVPRVPHVVLYASGGGSRGAAVEALVPCVDLCGEVAEEALHVCHKLWVWYGEAVGLAHV